MTDTPHGHSEAASQKIWDAPVRIAHWLLAAAFFFSWWTAENALFDWHRLSGYTILGLVIFRLYWGFAGSYQARFSSFLRGPITVMRYAGSLFSRTYRPTLGHNPMGGWSVALMLALLLAHIASGLFAIDVDGIESGPLNHFVEFDTGREASAWRHFTFDILLALIALHVAAVLFHTLVKREALIPAMIHGRKRLSAHENTAANENTGQFAPPWRALPGVVIAVAIAYAIAKGLRFG